LRPIKTSVYIYIDDIVYNSKSLLEYLDDLYKLFTLFTEVGIFINSSKIFLGYPDISLLG